MRGKGIILEMIAVEDYEKEKRISRPYNYVNINLFAQLPVIGTNGALPGSNY